MSTAAASCPQPRCSRPRPRPEGISTISTTRWCPLDQGHAGRPVEPTSANAKPNQEWTKLKTGKHRARPEDHGARSRWQEENVAGSVPDEELVGRYSALDMVTSRRAKSMSRPRRVDDGLHARFASKASGNQRHQRRSHQYRPCSQHHGGGQEPQQRAGPCRHLSRDASGEPPTAEPLRRCSASSLRCGTLRSLSVGRVKMNMRLGRCARCHPNLRKEDILRFESARRSARRRGEMTTSIPGNRRAVGRRIDGNQFRVGPAHGARNQGTHELRRHRHGDAARSDQCEACGGRGSRVLRPSQLQLR